MKLFSRSACLLTFVFIAALNAFGGDTPPSWMKQAAASAVPSYDKEVSAVVLHKEQIVTVNSDNVMVTTENYAVKILSREGRKRAIARAFYLVSAGKVREIEGWLIRPDGTVKNYDKKSILDVISDPDDVYNEYRLKVIDGSDDADAGAIFGYTTVSEDRPLYFQEKWFSQFDLPTILSRCQRYDFRNIPTREIAEPVDELLPELAHRRVSAQAAHEPAAHRDRAERRRRQVPPRLRRDPHSQGHREEVP